VRILVVDSVYPGYIAQLEATHPGLAQQSYATQLQAFYAAGMGTADGYVAPLRDLGHETAHILCNHPDTQRAWLREHPAPIGPWLAARLDRQDRTGQLARRLTLGLQVEQTRPDVLFIHDQWETGDRQLDWLRRRVPFLVGQIASYPPPIERLQRFDLMLSSFPHFVERFRAAGIDSELFGLAFLPAVTDRLAARGVSTAPDAAGRAGAVFVGGFYPSTYGNAIPAMERLCAEVDIALYGPEPEAVAVDSPIRRRWRGQAWGLDMYQRFARAAVVVNRHSDYAEGFANNMRLYEATGAGAALVTEAAPNLAELFTPEVEVATYDGADALVATVRELLADPERAQRIAAAGQRRTLAEHTYPQRMEELSQMLVERQAAGRFRPRRA
jgi:spore maturation protein CgeB